MLLFCPLGNVDEGVGIKNIAGCSPCFRRTLSFPQASSQTAARRVPRTTTRPGFQCLSGPVAEESSGTEAKLLCADAVCVPVEEHKP